MQQRCDSWRVCKTRMTKICLKYEQFLKSCLRIPASRASALTVALTIMQLVAPGHFLLARHAHTRP